MSHDAGGSVGATAGQRFLALDSLRGICALIVALYHFETFGRIYNSGLVRHGFLFVDFFFVLSGFVIAHSYRARIASGFSIASFMGLRLGRVYPLHIVMLFAFLLFELLFSVAAPGYSDRAPFSGAYSIGAWVLSLLLLQIFAGPTDPKWNGPAWSIAAEYWTYLLFALATRFAGRALWIVCAIVAVAMPLTLLAFNSDKYLLAIHYGAMARCLYGFSLGALGNIWFHARGRPFASGGMATLLEAAVAAAALGFVALISVEPASLLAPPVFLGVVLVFAFARGGVSRLLERPLPLLLGTLSYSIYMVHELVEYRFANALQLLEKALGGRYDLLVATEGRRIVGIAPWFGDLMSLAVLLVIVGVAWLTYRLIERPGQRLTRRWLQPNASSVNAAERAAPTF